MPRSGEAGPGEHAVADPRHVVLEGAAIAAAAGGAIEVIVADELAPERGAVADVHAVVPGEGDEREEQDAARQLEARQDLARAAGEQEKERDRQRRQRQARGAFGERRQRAGDPRDLQVQLPARARAGAPPGDDRQREHVGPQGDDAGRVPDARAEANRAAQLDREEDELRQRQRHQARERQPAAASRRRARLVGREQRDGGASESDGHRRDERQVGHRLARDEEPLRRGR